MANPVTEAGAFKNFTATTTLSIPGLKLLGIFVASSSSGTIKLQDGSDTIVNTFSTSAGTFYPIPVEVKTSLVITVTGTQDATALYSV
jgi:hypothetical protein